MLQIAAGLRSSLCVTPLSVDYIHLHRFPIRRLETLAYDSRVKGANSVVNKSLQLVAVICTLTTLVDQSVAQRGGGGGCNRGGAMGNSSPMMAGGNQRMAAGVGFMPNVAMMGQLASMSRQRPQIAMGGRQMNFRRPQRPSAEQFARAAGRYDRNGDGLLNRAELTQVAAAVITELRQRRERDGRFTSARSEGQRPADIGQLAFSAEQMTQTFLVHSLSFDADDDGALNATETRSMAAALIRSLG